MRIIAGAWRGQALVAPPGTGTRPTADRVRQALFDMLLHAPWGGRAMLEQARVLDALRFSRFNRRFSFRNSKSFTRISKPPR